MEQAAGAVTWGRTHAPQWFNDIGAAVMIAFCPFWMWLNWAAMEHFDGSLVATIRNASSSGPRSREWRFIPQHSHSAAFGYTAWVFFQALLYHYLPGKTCQGQQTPGGNVLSYTTNGLAALCTSLCLYIVASAAGIIRPTLIAEH